jgi:ribosome biogenesis protein BRX1
MVKRSTSTKGNKATVAAAAVAQEESNMTVEKDVVEQEIDEDEEAEDTTPVPIQPIVSDGRYRNKQRCLVLCSRGVTARYRHLLEDLRTLMPHHKRESKLDAGNDGIGRAVNDIAEMRSCNTVLLLECRKRQDCYMWLGRVGGQAQGPTVKFHVTNVHTMDELRLTGNCMKGSRPLLTFDSNFDKLGHLKLLKELFVDTFGKPFIDRVMCFYYADKRVRFVYHVVTEESSVSMIFYDERMSDLRV